MAVGESKSVVIAALVANAGIALAKGVAAVFTGSGAMLAETIHSIADSGNQALLLFGGYRSQRPPDAKHPFGYGSERYFWAFIVALVLFALGAVFSIYEGIHKLGHPEPLRNVGWAYGVLAFGVAIEGWSFTVARKVMLKQRGSRSFVQYFLESKNPEVPLVYLEDLGATLGLMLAFCGVAGSHLLGWTWADGAATLCVGVLLAFIAVALLLRCHRFLIGESVSAADGRAVLRAVREVPGVTKIHGLQTLHHGPETVIVIMDVAMEGDAGEVVDHIETAVREALPIAKYIAIEPV
jgi:cation diffusion facilitator family transporter